jgi:hypothetical protein
MNGRPLTDAQISGALRARLPERAQAGLRERVLETVETTSQQRAWPSFLGGVTDADPVARRRSLLLAAALLVALALAGAAAVGAWRLLHRDPPHELISLETPAEIQAFVFSSYERLPHLPPEAITTIESNGSEDRIYVDRSGAVRLERYASADATEPATSMLLSGHRFGRTLVVGPNKVWVDYDEAIGEDPRGYLRALSRLLEFSGGSDCAMSQSDLGDGTTAAGWRSIGADSVAGRRAHHFACGGGDLWLDDETRLILRVRQPATDDAGNPIPGASATTEVTQIEFGDQPPTLFDFSPPDGVAAMPLDTYDALCRPGQDTGAFLDYPPCSGTPPVAEATPTPEPTPSPTPSAPPGSSVCAIPSPDRGTPGPLAWTTASVTQDWPAPVRPEQAGGASIAPMPPTYIDPSGDTGSDVLPCVDIRDLTVDTYDVSVNLVASPAPDVGPSKAWIAYGVVVDEDGDGVPDWRYGIDNLPRPAGDEQGHHRAWRTDLHTGRTESAEGSEEFGEVGETFFSTRYPGRAPGANARFSFGDRFDVAGQGEVTKGTQLDKPFYAWASVIVDGRVVATDYAPDTGWLLPSPGAKPGGTYVVHRDDRFPLRISMSIPSGWSGRGSSVWDVREGDEGDEGSGLELMIIDEPVEIACEPSGGSVKVPVGPGVDDLVTLLAGLKVNEISENTGVTLDGYRGNYLAYTATVRDGDDDDCHPRPWPAFGNPEHSQADWILDVDGVRLVIHASAPTHRKTVNAELRRIVESIDIGP